MYTYIHTALFCGHRGLFSRARRARLLLVRSQLEYAELFCKYIGLFGGYVGLFCGYMGLFC